MSSKCLVISKTISKFGRLLRQLNDGIKVYLLGGTAFVTS